MSNVTRALTLTEFLTARLDEDEAIARDALGESYVMSDGDWTLRFLARHDPARVLREVEAKRAILEEFVRVRTTGVDYELGYGLTVALRALASAYADHPDYREEWAL